MTPASKRGARLRSFDSGPGVIAVVLLAGLVLALLAAYANHFHNAFHFDDFHTITDNPAIRSLANVAHFFADPRTFSVLPTHYSYRPLVSASLALDYWLAKGLHPLWFHISTLVWYAVQLGLMYLLYVRIMNLSGAARTNSYWAAFAVAVYALHPANAETINYVIQRGDVYSALGVVAGLVIYCFWPRSRKWGVYLLPVALGALAKQTALVFPALLFIYSALFENQQDQPADGPLTWLQLRRAAIASLPSAAVCSALAIFEIAMTPKTFVGGSSSNIQYWLTQPIVALHYFKSFFLPTELSADTDRPLVTNIFSETSVIGFGFLGAVCAAVWHTMRTRQLRPVAFGLFWFLIALLPTSLIPLAEPENDHRMFLPFAGLTLAAVWAVRLLVEKKKLWERSPGWRAALVGGGLGLLVACGYGTHQRNAVWRTEESLWKDVTEKSPHNGRGLMNYGLTQMSKGNAAVAYEYFQRAVAFTPNYSTLEINLGVAAGLLHRDGEAEEHFRRAMALAPDDSQSYSFYGRWLQSRGRIPEAISVLHRSASLNSADLDPRYTLMTIYSQHSDWADVKRTADEILQVSPGDAQARAYIAAAQGASTVPGRSGNPVSQQQTAEGYLNSSLSYCKTGRYEECVQAAKEALRLKPNYAEAYNNIAAGYQSIGRWGEAIAAAQEAIRLKPDFQLAKNNLAYAMSEKARTSKEVALSRR